MAKKKRATPEERLQADGADADSQQDSAPDKGTDSELEERTLVVSSAAETPGPGARLDQFITAEPRLSWHRPEAGLIGLARVTGTNGESLARALLAPPWRTFLLPGSAYGLPDHIRLGVGGGPEARTEEGLTRLSRFLAQAQA